jgi:hypothetical protein
MPYTKRNRLLHRLVICFVGNMALMSILFTLIICFAEESKYFRFGPREDFSIVGVKINTWERYLYLHAVLLATQTVDVLVSEFSNPILGFNIYNPDKEVITDFTHVELQFFAQSMWLINGIRAALMLLVTISQLDIAVAKVVYTELTGVFTVYFLLSEKKFVLDKGNTEREEPLLDDSVQV